MTTLKNQSGLGCLPQGIGEAPRKVIIVILISFENYLNLLSGTELQRGDFDTLCGAEQRTIMHVVCTGHTDVVRS